MKRSKDGPATLSGSTPPSRHPDGRLAAERLAQSWEIAAVSFGVAIVKKELIVIVRHGDIATMLDRAPVLLGPGENFLDVAHHAFCVAAVQAVGLLYPIEIGELVAVDREVRAATQLPAMP